MADSASVKMPPGPRRAGGRAQLVGDALDLAGILADDQRAQLVDGRLQRARQRRRRRTSRPAPRCRPWSSTFTTHEIAGRAGHGLAVGQRLVGRQAHDLRTDALDFHVETPAAARKPTSSYRGRTDGALSMARLPEGNGGCDNSRVQPEEMAHACGRARRAFHGSRPGPPHRSGRHQPPRLPTEKARPRRPEPAGACARDRRAAPAVDGRGRHHRAGALQHRPRPRSRARRRRRRPCPRDERSSGGGDRPPSRPLRGLRRPADAEPGRPPPTSWCAR